MSLIDLDFNIDSNMMVYALVGLLFLWLFFRIFNAHRKTARTATGFEQINKLERRGLFTLIAT